MGLNGTETQQESWRQWRLKVWENLAFLRETRSDYTPATISSEESGLNSIIVIIINLMITTSSSSSSSGIDDITHCS